MSDAAAIAEDRDARRLAQTQFEGPLVLEAGAGTGKTTTLVARIVVWCLGRGWERAADELRRRAPGGAAVPADDEIAARVVRGLVAITFTEAAAAEMATRVGRTLTELAADPKAPEGILDDCLPDPALRPARARALVGVLDRLVVRTIHAFCRRLLASHPLEAGLHPGFEVDADGSLVAGVAREEIESALHEAYAEEGDPAFRALAEHGVGPGEIAEAVETLAAAGVPAEAFAAEAFTAERRRALRDALREHVEAILARGGRTLATLKGAPAVVETVERLGRAAARLRALADPGDDSAEALIASVADELGPRLPQLAKWRDGKLGVKEAGALGDGAPRFLAEAEFLHGLVAHVLALDVPRFEAARAVLAPLLARVDEALRRKGVVSFDGLLRGARDLLARRSDVAALERARIEQLLVDEFQDTDPTQCALLAALALDGPPDRRPGLFLVGDPKQSIFGWRRADLRAYDDFLDRLGRDHVRRLCVNFRSAPAILAEVTRLVEPVMHEERGVQPAFQRLEASERTANAKGCRDDRFAPVEHWLSCRIEDGAPAARTNAPQANGIEARAVAADLVALRARHDLAWGKVALLFRSLTQVDVYLDALRSAGIPFEVAKDRSYYRRREVIEAAALLRCVVDPHDTLALVTWLRSVAVGVPDAALIPLWSRRLPERVARLRRPSAEALGELAELVRGAAASTPADVPGIGLIAGWDASLVAALESLARLRASFEHDPCDVFVERLRVETGIEALEAARHLGAYRLANLDRFFRELAATLAEERDPAALLRRLREDVGEGRETLQGSLRESAADAVQVLSIHAAKGLDFEHVYCLQLHKESGGRGGRETPPVEIGVVEGELALRLFGAPGPRDHLWKRAQARREDAEARRLLYVATTRAKSRLVLAGLRAARSGSPRTAKAKNLAVLVAERAGDAVDVAALAQEVAGVPGRRHIDASDARWVFPELAPENVEGPRGEPSPSGATAEAAEADRAGLERARADAAKRAARRALAPATATSHEAFRERFEADEPRSDGTALVSEREPAGTDRALARAIGTAVHRLLEDAALALDAPASAVGARLRSELAGLVPVDRVEAAAREAGELLEAFRRGPLGAELRALETRGAVVARELPLLATLDRADPGGPVGAISGAIDLLYREGPDAYVVADYKTDHVAPDEDVSAKAERYAAQGAAYLRAVQEYFRLDRPPRFELWFLRAGRVVPDRVLARG